MVSIKNLQNKSINYVNLGTVLSLFALIFCVCLYLLIITQYLYPNYTNNTYVVSQYPFTNLLNILGILIGSFLTSTITLILYNNTLLKEREKEEKRRKEEREKILSTISVVIGDNKSKSELVLEALEDEIETLSPDSDYKIPLLDIFPFTQTVMDNIKYFLDEQGMAIIGIAVEAEYLSKCLEYREDLILHHFNSDILSKIEEQDKYLIDQLKKHIDSITKYENQFIMNQDNKDLQ